MVFVTLFPIYGAILLQNVNIYFKHTTQTLTICKYFRCSKRKILWEERTLQIFDTTLPVPHHFVSNRISLATSRIMTYKDVEDVNNSLTSVIGFHCHNLETKDHQDTSKNTKRKLLPAIFVVFLFLCIEVK